MPMSAASASMLMPSYAYAYSIAKRRLLYDKLLHYWKISLYSVFFPFFIIKTLGLNPSYGFGINKSLRLCYYLYLSNHMYSTLYKITAQYEINCTMYSTYITAMFPMGTNSYRLGGGGDGGGGGNHNHKKYLSACLAGLVPVKWKPLGGGGGESKRSNK